MIDRIIILGGTGFIGQSLLPKLSVCNAEVFVFTRSSSNKDVYRSKNIKYILWEDDKTKQLAQYLTENTSVINLVGENIGNKRWTKTQKRKIIESRLRMSETMQSACKLANIKPDTLIQASAIGYYPAKNNEEMDERSQNGNGYLASVVDQWEKSISFANGKYRRVLILRIGVVLGKNGGIMKKLSNTFRFFIGGYLGNGKQYISWIHEKDVVNAIVFLLTNEEKEGIFNLTSPTPVTMKEICRTYGNAIRKPSWFHVPAFILKLVFGKEMTDEILLSCQTILPKRLLDQKFSFEFPSISSAINEITH